jgi:site-specific DNA recombinase
VDHAPAPELQIIDGDLAQRVSARLAERAALYPRSRDRKLFGRPRFQDESAYLLTGFAACSVCGGPVGTEVRRHGVNGGARTTVPHYACLDHKRRGDAVCTNGVALRQDVLDRAILQAIADVLHPTVLARAVELAVARLTAHHAMGAERRAIAERGLQDVQRELDRLVDALADGTLPADEIRARLNVEKARKTALEAELAACDAATQRGHDPAALRRQLEARVADVVGLLGRQTPQARQMLRRVLAGKIDLEPIGSGRDRGYKFRERSHLIA